MPPQQNPAMMDRTDVTNEVALSISSPSKIALFFERTTQDKNAYANRGLRQVADIAPKTASPYKLENRVYHLKDSTIRVLYSGFLASDKINAIPFCPKGVSVEERLSDLQKIIEDAA